MLDDILIEIVAAIVVAVVGSITYAIRVRRRRGGSEPAGALPVVVTKDGVPQQIPPQLQGVVDLAMSAAADGKVDADEEAAIRAAALAAGAKGIAFGDPEEHVGPPPPGPAAPE